MCEMTKPVLMRDDLERAGYIAGERLSADLSESFLDAALDEAFRERPDGPPVILLRSYCNM